MARDLFRDSFVQYDKVLLDYQIPIWKEGGNKDGVIKRISLRDFFASDVIGSIIDPPNWAVNDLTVTASRTHNLSNYTVTYNSGTIIHSGTTVTRVLGTMFMPNVIQDNTLVKIAGFDTFTGELKYTDLSNLTGNFFNKTTDTSDDITEGVTNLFLTGTERTKLNFITVTQNVNLDTMESDITINNAKISNIPTVLSTGTVTSTTYAITSDGGIDDVVLVEATASTAGLLSAAKWNEIVANTAKVTNATHTSEVTGATALTVQPLAISNKALLASPTGTEELLVNDAGTLKKILVSSLGATGGKAAIYDASGKPTFYSDLNTAIIAANAGGFTVVRLFSNLTITAPIAPITGVDIDLNGYTVTNNANDTTETFLTHATNGYVGKVFNGYLEKTNGTGSVINVQNSAGAVRIDWTGTTAKSTTSSNIFSSGRTDTEANQFNLTVIGTTNSYGVFAPNLTVKGFIVKTTTSRGIYAGLAIDCQVDAVSGECYRNTNTINCKGKSTGNIYFGGTHYFSWGSTTSGEVYSGAYTVNCYGYSTTGWTATSGTYDKSTFESISAAYTLYGTDAIQCNVTSYGGVPIRVSGEASFNRVYSAYNNAAAIGIYGDAGAEIVNNFVRILNASSYAIYGAGAGINQGLNSRKGGAGIYDPASTLLNVNTSSAQGDLSL